MSHASNIQINWTAFDFWRNPSNFACFRRTKTLSHLKLWLLGEIIMCFLSIWQITNIFYFFQQQPLHLGGDIQCFEKLPPLPMSFNNYVENILPFFATYYLPLCGHLLLWTCTFFTSQINKVEHLLFPAH